MFPLISPLEARKDGSYFVVIVIGLLIIAVAIGIGILLAILSKKKAAKFNNPDRKTTKADIETVAKKMELNEIETGFLAYICKKHNVPNLLLTIKDNDKLMQIFKDEVENFVHYDEQMKAVYFNLRNKIEFFYNIEHTITSTRQIEKFTNVVFIYENDRYLSNIERIADDGIYLTMPLNIAGEELGAKLLTKVMMMFSSPKNYLGYKCSVRIIKHETLDDKKFIVIAHTNNLVVIHRRHSRRIPFDKEVHFRAVSATEDHLTGKKSFKILDTPHTGKFSDLSPTGCAIITQLAIKPKQYIYIEFDIAEDKKAKIIGLIINVEYNKYTELYSLHIKFEKIDLKTSNLINEMYLD